MAGYSPLRFSAYARDLELAILQLSAEHRMGIADLRKTFSQLPGVSSMTMSYKDGGKTEVYSIGPTSVEVPAGTGDSEIADAIKKKLHSRPVPSIKSH